MALDARPALLAIHVRHQADMYVDNLESADNFVGGYTWPTTMSAIASSSIRRHSLTVSNSL